MNMYEDNYEGALDVINELEIDLCTALYHMFNVMSLCEGPRYISQHEYWIEAQEFWNDMREGKCHGIKSVDGVKHYCPNDTPKNWGWCTECRAIGG